MSHCILYRAMFVRLADGSYIPMVESGDNNVWDAFRNRRSREWCSCRWCHETEEQRQRYSLTRQEILDAVQKEVDRNIEQYEGKEHPFGGKTFSREDVLADFSFFCCMRISGSSTMTASQFLNFFRSGFKYSATMEDLQTCGCRIRLSWWEGDELKEDFAATEEELSRKWAARMDRGYLPYLGLDYCSESVWRRVRQRNARPPKEKKALEEYFVIAFTYHGSERYVTQVTSSSLKFNSSQEYAHRYSSRKVAENAGEKLSRRFSDISNIRVERIAV